MGLCPPEGCHCGPPVRLSCLPCLLDLCVFEVSQIHELIKLCNYKTIITLLTATTTISYLNCYIIFNVSFAIGFLQVKTLTYELTMKSLLSGKH